MAQDGRTAGRCSASLSVLVSGCSGPSSSQPRSSTGTVRRGMDSSLKLRPRRIHRKYLVRKKENICKYPPRPVHNVAASVTMALKP